MKKKKRYLLYSDKSLDQDIQELQRVSDAVHCGGMSGRVCFASGVWIRQMHSTDFEFKHRNMPIMFSCFASRV